jgi:hypothetical protein
MSFVALIVSVASLCFSGFAVWLTYWDKRRVDRRAFLEDSEYRARQATSLFRLVAVEPEARGKEEVVGELLEGLSRLRPRSLRWHEENFYPAFETLWNALTDMPAFTPGQVASLGDARPIYQADMLNHIADLSEAYAIAAQAELAGNPN